jgi:hypothetical protein
VETADCEQGRKEKYRYLRLVAMITSTLAAPPLLHMRASGLALFGTYTKTSEPMGARRRIRVSMVALCVRRRADIAELVGTRYWRGTRDRALSPANAIAAVASSLAWSVCRLTLAR